MKKLLLVLLAVAFFSVAFSSCKGQGDVCPAYNITVVPENSPVGNG